MGVRPVFALLAVLLTAGASLECAREEAPRPSARTVASANDAEDGKILLDRMCTVCHTLERVTSRKASRAKWIEIIRRMQAKEPGIIDEAAAGKILAYLSTLPGD
jgi:cytochrome c5